MSRVLQAQHVDRVPLNVFAGWNTGAREQVEQKYGSVDAFYQQHHIDIVTGVLPRFPFGGPEEHAQIADLDRYLELDPIDPSAPHILADSGEDSLFLSVNDALQYHEQEKAVFVHTWGVFELSQFLFEKNGMPGTQDALLNMLAEKEKSMEIYQKLARWSAGCLEGALRAGVDAVELSDDWGQQNTMLFSPDLWWEMIFPATKIIVDTARKYNVPVILHSDGDITKVLDGIKELGLSGLHPVQESAGMSFQKIREALGSDFCIMGGLDTVTALPQMNEAEIRDEVSRVFDGIKNSGPFIFAGSHMFQDDTPLTVIDAAYEQAYQLAFF